jgi:hypothetical protein
VLLEGADIATVLTEPCIGERERRSVLDERAVFLLQHTFVDL